MFSFNRTIDNAVLKPVAKGYKAVTPKFVDIGISNFFSNLGDVVVIANDLLQLNPEQAAQNTLRLSVNSTLGLLGLIDIATPMGLPKTYEDFGQTLGYWGVGEGYYLILPLLGPSSTRDVFQYPVDYFFYPVSYVDPTSDRLALRAVELIDFRADLLPADRALEDALDPYIFLREAYLERRRNLVHDGNPPEGVGVDLDGLEDFIDDSSQEQPPAESPATQ
jgi:phospholipid-binding lipoprotein MlaA